MTHDTWIDRLSEYLDGDLDAREHQQVEAHLASCGSCRQALADLRSIASAAARLPVIPPERDLWDGIETRISASAPFTRRRPARRFSFTLPQLAAAGIALMVLSGALVYLARSGDPRADFPQTSATASVPGEATTPVRLVDPQYDAAISDLQQALQEGRARLDPETVRVLEENLGAIDQAIAQCRMALEADPANAFLNSHLASARQRKLALLRKATALTTGS